MFYNWLNNSQCIFEEGGFCVSIYVCLHAFGWYVCRVYINTSKLRGSHEAKGHDFAHVSENVSMTGFYVYLIVCMLLVSEVPKMYWRTREALLSPF